MSSRLVLLGTGTCVLDAGRSASAVLVELGETRFVFDFGRGVATRVAELGLVQDQLRHVILSHFHPDHFSDLIPYLHAALHAPGDTRSETLHVYGPHGLEEVMSDVMRLAGVLESGESASFRVELHRLSPTFTVDGLVIGCHHLPPAGNHGIRFEHDGQITAITGDSHFHDDEIEFLREADLAIIDAGHLSDQEVVEVAVASRVGRLVCSHLYRELDGDSLRGQARKLGFEGDLIVGEDLMEFAL